MLTTACCLVVGLGLGLHLVPSYAHVFMYLDYFPLSLSLSPWRYTAAKTLRTRWQWPIPRSLGRRAARRREGGSSAAPRPAR